MTRAVFGSLLMLMAMMGGNACQTRHKVETVHRIEVAPMHITIDVNVKVDRALDDFFADLDKAEEKMQP